VVVVVFVDEEAVEVAEVVVEVAVVDGVMTILASGFHARSWDVWSKLERSRVSMISTCIHCL